MDINNGKKGDNNMISNSKVLDDLKLEYGEYLDLDLPIPKPYYENLNSVKVILLGSNPMYIKDSTEAAFVFNLSTFKQGLEGEAIFGNIYNNLQLVDLGLKDIYAENLCKNHLKNITVHDEAWVRIASIWGKNLKVQLDKLFSKDIPVFITAPWILKALGKEIRDGMYYYTSNEFIKPEDNILDRLLIPFFRQKQYDLSKEMFTSYRDKIKKHIK